MKHRIAALFASVAFTDTCPTVIIETENGPVTINASDYNPQFHKLSGASASDEPELFDAPPTAAVVEPPAAVVDELPTAPSQQLASTQSDASGYLTMKKGKKVFVVDAAGNPVTRDGIDADGYATDADAWKAIMALNAAPNA